MQKTSYASAPSTPPDNRLRVHWVLLVTRELLKLRVVNLLKLGASQRLDETTNRVLQLGGGTSQEIWLGLCSQLVGKASEVVALRKSLEVEEATRKISDVDTSE